MLHTRDLGLGALAVAALGSFGLIGTSGCRNIFSEPFDVHVNLDALADVTVDPTRGKGLGEACDEDQAISECRFGLKCFQGECIATGDAPKNRPCLLTAECGDNLYCSLAGVCADAGAGAVGTGCATSGDCQKGLVCRSLGFAGSCVEAGPGDVHAACDDSGDCMAGLACGEDETCVVGNVVFGPKPWAGVACEGPVEGEAPVVYFEVPRVTLSDDSDFFRLPFPNDIRLSADATVDLSGFPTPGPGLVGFDPVARAIQAAEKVQRGWSTEPAIIFRFSQDFDFASVWAGGIKDPPPGDPTIYFVNIDKDSEQFGSRPDFGYSMTNGGSRYICPRYLALHPAWYTPLLPGTTYAVILADGITMGGSTHYGRDADFDVMMKAEIPTDAALVGAWQRYQPLRDYLADPEAELPAGRVIAAAVFTTQQVDDVMPRIREAVHAAAMPQPKSLTLCDGATTSPCDDGLSGEAHTRGCFDVSDAAYELHMKVPLPIVQHGTRPYLSPEDGGDLVITPDSGSVVVQGSEDVCVSLTIPKGVSMPPNGWPVMIYGHGTGGTFRSSVRDEGLALAHLTYDDHPEMPAIGVAVLGWDGPMHGSRRGAELDPEGLFYNFANPLAARGNLYQGAADQFALTRALKAWVIPANESPTGSEIRFDGRKIIALGHSQGGSTGPLATPYEPDTRAVIWSGAGGGLVQSLLAKKSPVDAPRAVAIALQELTDQNLPAELSDLHPALAIVQGLFDPVDPLNHARFQVRERRAGMPPVHVLQSYGMDDSFTPPATIEAFGRVLGLAVAAPVLKDYGITWPKLTPPVVGNLDAGLDGKVTAVQIQVQPDGYDGHFVLFRNAAAAHQLQQWVATFVRDGVPTLVPATTP